MMTKTAMTAVALTGLLVCQPANADAPECAGTLTSGSLQKFLKAQGREKKDLFFPPVRNYLGFTGTPSYPNDDSESSDPCPFPENFNFALVDYAGLAGNYLQKQGVDLGTQVRGRVWECTEPDGVTEVTVKLVTTRALGFAQSVRELCDSGFDFANTPTIFGNKAVDVADGALPAVGSAIFKASFIVEKPKKFPDLTEVDLDSSDGLQIPYFTKQDFHSLTFGKCYDGANHGKPCIMTVVQDASLEGDEFVFHTEQIDIIRLECDD